MNNNEKIMVCNNIHDVRKFVELHKDKYICLYLAYKSEEAWDISTSRVYMNQINSNLIYLPVNIKKDDLDSIREVYKLSEENKHIIAINQTQPHKSNSVLYQWFEDEKIPTNVDCLIKDKNNKLRCYDLNGPSFTDWFTEEITSFKDKTVILLGVGGVGEPIARRIAKEGLKDLFLIDINSKEELVNELSEYNFNVKYFKTLGEIKIENKNIIFINCAGKEGTNDENANDFLKIYHNKENIFVDLRPQLDIDIVNLASELEWKSYTGFGMNARNDYTILKIINEITGMDIPSFEEFKKLVSLAS